MRIVVVSGFLGSGKTTFIKELIRRTKKKLVVLENEYGENDLDSQDLMNANNAAGANELEVLEFMEGCVCCTQKDSFSNTILSISASLDPEYLVVEPTGVGKLSNIHANIKRVSWEKIQLLRSIVVLSPQSLFANVQTFGDICKDQISNANVVVLSKIEHADRSVIAAAVDYVRSINAKAEIVSQHYTYQGDTWWSGLLLKDGEKSNTIYTRPFDEILSATFADCHNHLPNDQNNLVHNNSYETDAASKSFHHSLDDKHTFSHAHKDKPHANNDSNHLHDLMCEHDIQQITIKDAHMVTLAQLIVFLEDVVRKTFGSIPRAKGVLQVGSEWIRFDVADDMYGIVADEGDKHKTQCVFIGRHLNEAALLDRMHNSI